MSGTENAQCVENLGSWFPRMTRRSTPSSEMLASLTTPPLEPSRSMARDRAEERQWVSETVVECSSQHALQQRRCVTCGGDLHALLFVHPGFVVGVHEAVDVGAAAAAHRHRLPHQHPTNRDAVHLRQVTHRRCFTVCRVETAPSAGHTKDYTSTCPGGVRSHLPALPLVPACHQDPSCQLLPVTVAARSEQIGCRLHQWGLVQLDAVGGAKDTGEYWPHLSWQEGCAKLCVLPVEAQLVGDDLSDGLSVSSWSRPAARTQTWRLLRSRSSGGQEFLRQVLKVLQKHQASQRFNRPPSSNPTKWCQMFVPLSF